MQTTNNLRRRLSFGVAFKAYPLVLKGFARAASLSLPGEKTRQGEEHARMLLEDPNFPRRVVSVLAALFATKLLVQRWKLEEEVPEEDRGDTKALHAFITGANNRLQAHTIERLEGFSLSATDLPTKALLAFEEDMLHVVFNAFTLDAQRADFDEPAFWSDVFRALADTDPSGAIVRGLSVVVLDRLDELRHALRVTAGGHVLDLQAATTH